MIYRLFPPQPYWSLDLQWIRGGFDSQLTATSHLIFHVKMPYSLMLIYFSILFFTIGQLIYEITRPKFAARGESVAPRESIMQNFRQIAWDLPKRSSTYFVVHLLKAFTANYDALKKMTDEQIAEARKQRPFRHLEGLLPEDSKLKMNRDSIWYYAREMAVKEECYAAFEEANAWWIGYTFPIWRFACGISYSIALLLSVGVILQGNKWLFYE